MLRYVQSATFGRPSENPLRQRSGVREAVPPTKFTPTKTCWLATISTPS